MNELIDVGLIIESAHWDSSMRDEPCEDRAIIMHFDGSSLTESVQEKCLRNPGDATLIACIVSLLDVLKAPDYIRKGGEIPQ